MTGICIPTVVPEDAPPPEATIVNDGWFPDIDPADFRAARRVAESVTPARVREVLLGAIVTVGNQLAAWHAARVTEGAAALDQVASAELGGESRLVILYRRAVYAEAKAELVERFRDIDITGKGERKAEDLDPSIGELRRDSIHAIRDMLGRGRTDVELI